MGELTQEAIETALRAVKYPGYSRHIVSFGLVKDIELDNGAVTIWMELTSPNPEVERQIKEASEHAVRELRDVHEVRIELKQPTPTAKSVASDPWAHQARVPGIRNVIAASNPPAGNIGRCWPRQGLSRA